MPNCMPKSKITKFMISLLSDISNNLLMDVIHEPFILKGLLKM